MKNIWTELFGRILVIFGVPIIVLTVILFFWGEDLFNYSFPINSEKFGHFGDFIGGFVGSMWAVAGVILFYVALVEQRKDFRTNREVMDVQLAALQQQIKEFELQREELRETRKIFQVQSETLKLQQFESTFFNLLHQHHTIVGGIDLFVEESKNPSKKQKPFWKGIANRPKYVETEENYVHVSGRDCFVIFADELKKIYRRNMKEEGVNEKILLQEVYKKFFISNQSDLGHYFRNLYHIFKFIDNSEVDSKDRYASLVRAQLSNDELLVLFYNVVSTYGQEKFLPLAIRYKLLKNLNKSTLFNDSHSSLFSKKIFGQ